MVWAMVALGGATRLSGSGLSIMEWAPIMGTVPPMSEAEWQRLYDLYRTIPQYALVNQGFGMEGFKRIFWLEWAHRFWGRAIGLVYAAGLVWFWVRGRIPAGLKPRLLLLLVLGGLQGAVGWFMVASGFEADRTAVSPWRLVAHLGLALALYAALFWTALGLLLRRDAARMRPSARGVAERATAGAGGGLAARGGHAGGRLHRRHPRGPRLQHLSADGRAAGAGGLLAARARRGGTSPRMSRRCSSIIASWRRWPALAAFGAAFAAWRRLPEGPARRACLGLGAAVALQYALGVATLLLVVPAWLGTLHQATAVLVLTAALLALRRLRAGAPCGGASRRRGRAVRALPASSAAARA